MKQFKITLIVLSLLIPSIASAGGWSQQGTIERINTTNAGYILVDIHGVTENPDFCPKSHYYQLQESMTGFANNYSLLLGQKYNESDLKFYLNGCSSNGFPLVKQVLGY